MDNIWLHRYAVLLACCTLVLVVAGGLVTSNAAGMSVPDWPLSYGRIMPPMVGGVVYEHSHRLVATTVGLLTIGLVVFLWKTESRRWLRHLGLVALAAVVLQGVLGGVTVLYRLPYAVSVSHACLAQLFFSTTVAIALFTSPGWKKGPVPVEAPGRWPLGRMTVITAASILVQLALGAAFRHRALNLLPHVIWACVVVGMVFTTAISVLGSFSAHPALGRAARTMLWLTPLQVILGIAAYFSRITTMDSLNPAPVMVAFTVAHVAAGALTMASSVVLAIEVFRNVQKAAE